MKDELRGLTGGFGTGHRMARSHEQAEIDRLSDELTWFSERRAALLALVTDRGGVARTYNVRTGAATFVSDRLSVDDILQGLEQSYGEQPAVFLQCLRAALLKGGYIPEENRERAEALDLVYHVPQEQRARWNFPAKGRMQKWW